MISRRTVKELIQILTGTAIVACAVYFFMIPSHLTVGSVSAVAMVINNFLPLPISVISFGLNCILLALGLFLLGGDFGAKTIFTTILLPVMLGVLEILFPDVQSITQDPLLDALCYILVVSAGLSLLFTCNASSGGLDIIAKIMNKYLGMDLGKALSMSGMLVALSSALCYDKKTVVISVLATYFSGILLDHFIFGINIKRRVCILSKKHDQLLDYILHQLHSGATIYEGIGAYDNTLRREILTIVDKQEYRQLMDYIRKQDPEAFVTVIAVNEVKYLPKNTPKSRA